MRSELKIAQLTPYYWPAIGGVEVVCQSISEELVKRGHEVHVFTSNRTHKGTPRVKMPRSEMINGVSVHRFATFANVGHYKFFPGFIAPLMTGNFDVIHAHGYRQPQSEIGGRIGRFIKTPTVLHVHGGFYSNSTVKRSFYYLYDWCARRKALNKFDHFIALSEADRANLINLNIKDDDISVIRNAAEPDAFVFVDSESFKQKYGLGSAKIILYLGILHRYKRPDLLVRMLPALRSVVPSVFVLFVGPDAGELDQMRGLGETLGVSSCFKWIGPLQGKEKHEALCCSEFLALPSDEDPYPLVLLEAMAHGKPVLTTSVVGQAGVIKEHEAGIIVSPGDLQGLETGAKRLLTDSVYLKATAERARELAEAKFSVQSVIDEVKSLYTRVINSYS